jgi:hypothetical protein
MNEPPKRPIDWRRDSAISMTIEAADDESGTAATFQSDSRFCAVTGRRRIHDTPRLAHLRHQVFGS